MQNVHNYGSTEKTVARSDSGAWQTLAEGKCKLLLTVAVAPATWARLGKMMNAAQCSALSDTVSFCHFVIGTINRRRRRRFVSANEAGGGLINSLQFTNLHTSMAIVDINGNTICPAAISFSHLITVFESEWQVIFLWSFAALPLLCGESWGISFRIVYRTFRLIFN